MEHWNEVCITDKTGKKFFVTTASPMSTFPEIHNMKRHLENAKKFPDMYKFLDLESAHVLLNDSPYTETIQDPEFYDKLLEDLGIYERNK